MLLLGLLLRLGLTHDQSKLGNLLSSCRKHRKKTNTDPNVCVRDTRLDLIHRSMQIYTDCYNENQEILFIN